VNDWKRHYFYMTSDMYKQIPMKGVSILPDDGFPLTKLRVHGNGLELWVYCKPKNPQGELNRWGYRRRIPSHRVIAMCPCGKQIPFGRLGQHMPACEPLRDAKREADIRADPLDYNAYRE
jgi:hypothetical protein